MIFYDKLSKLTSDNKYNWIFSASKQPRVTLKSKILPHVGNSTSCSIELKINFCVSYTITELKKKNLNLNLYITAYKQNKCVCIYILYI